MGENKKPCHTLRPWGREAGWHKSRKGWHEIIMVINGWHDFQKKPTSALQYQGLEVWHDMSDFRVYLNCLVRQLKTKKSRTNQNRIYIFWTGRAAGK